MALSSGKWAVLLFACCAVCTAGEPQEILERFLAKTRAELAALPDYVCAHRIDRFSRGNSESPWKHEDTLRFVVGVAGGQEVYAKADGSGVTEASLAAHARYGVINSGEFGLMAGQVFTRSGLRAGYVGESERGGRKAYEFEYDVPLDESGYTLRMGSVAERVAFQGLFQVDADTLDLIELEIQAYDIPEKLALAIADTRVFYRRTPVRGATPLLPERATLQLATVEGVEHLNRAQFGDCRRFETDAALIAEERDETPTEVPAAITRIVPGALLELQLDEDLRPELTSPGDPIRARLLKPVEAASGALLPAGTLVHGHVARLRREDIPVPAYEIGFELAAFDSDGEILPVQATMVDVESRRGVIREARRLDPNFSRRHGSRAEVLVREVSKGQGILLWDAKRPVIPRGLKMKWVVGGAAPELSAERR